MKIFDVARWSDLDIIETMKEIGVEVENVDNFVELVIDHLRRNFNAEIGINWLVIQDAVECVDRELKKGV